MWDSVPSSPGRLAPAVHVILLWHTPAPKAPSETTFSPILWHSWLVWRRHSKGRQLVFFCRVGYVLVAYTGAYNMHISQCKFSKSMKSWKKMLFASATFLILKIKHATHYYAFGLQVLRIMGVFVCIYCIDWNLLCLIFTVLTVICDPSCPTGEVKLWLRI